jgi:hypothetical protein
MGLSRWATVGGRGGHLNRDEREQQALLRDPTSRPSLI